MDEDILRQNAGTPPRGDCASEAKADNDQELNPPASFLKEMTDPLGSQRTDDESHHKISHR